LFREIGNYLSGQGIEIVLVFLFLVVIYDEHALQRLEAYRGKLKRWAIYPILGYFIIQIVQVVQIVINHRQ
jgi:hypothetical protein